MIQARRRRANSKATLPSIESLVKKQVKAQLANTLEMHTRTEAAVSSS